jgi:integrase
VPTCKLTKTAIEKLKAPDPSGRQVLYWDNSLRGFGVLCSGVTSSKTYIAQRALPDGRTRRVTIAGVAEITVEKARERAAELLVEMRRGVDPKAKKETMTLRAALDAYLSTHSQRLRPRSAESYRLTVERQLGDWLDRPLPEITRDMVEVRHKRIADDASARSRRAAVEFAKRAKVRAARAEAHGWTEAAARHRAAAERAGQRTPTKGHAAANGAMRALRLLWNFAADKDPMLGANPVRLKKQWFVVPRRERLVRGDELPSFYSAVCALPNPVHRDYVLTLLFTGLRRREAATLAWEDVDFAGGVIRIPAVRTKAGRKLDLPMSDFIRDLLVARRRVGKTKFVFPSNSKVGHIVEPKFALDLIAKSSGVRVSAHDLRRTFVTVAESCEISPLALKALVNHSLGNDVTAGYVQMNAERLRGPVQRVCDRLKKLCGILAIGNGKLARIR